MIAFEELDLTPSDVDKCMIFIVDIDSKKIEFASPLAHRNLGYGKDELMELKIIDLHPYEMPEMNRFIRNLSNEKEAFTDSLSCISKNGNLLPAVIYGMMKPHDGKDYLVARVKLKEPQI